MTKKLVALKLRHDETTSFVHYAGSIIHESFEYDQDEEIIRFLLNQDFESKQEDGSLLGFEEQINKLFSTYNIDVRTKSTSRMVIGMDREYEELVDRYVDKLPGIRFTHRQGMIKNHQYLNIDIRAFILTKVIVQVPNSALNYLKLKNYNVFEALNYNLTQETIEKILQEESNGNY